MKYEKILMLERSDKDVTTAVYRNAPFKNESKIVKILF